MAARSTSRLVALVAGALMLVPVAAAAGAPACAPSPTRPVEPFGRLIGSGPVRAGSLFGARAVLPVSVLHRDGRFVGKLFWEIRRDGPGTVRVRGARTDAPGDLWLRVGGAKNYSGATVLRRARMDPNGDWVGAAGEVSLPAPGCYRLRARWPGGGWSVILSARARR